MLVWEALAQLPVPTVPTVMGATVAAAVQVSRPRQRTKRVVTAVTGVLVVLPSEVGMVASEVLVVLAVME